MKRFNVVFRENGKLEEKEIFAECASEVKKMNGFVAIMESGSLSHPSPEILQKVLVDCGLNIAETYSKFSAYEREMQAYEESLVASGDADAISRMQKREEKKAESLKKKIADLKKISRGTGDEAEKAKKKLAKLELNVR